MESWSIKIIINVSKYAKAEWFWFNLRELEGTQRDDDRIAYFGRTWEVYDIDEAFVMVEKEELGKYMANAKKRNLPKWAWIRGLEGLSECIVWKICKKVKYFDKIVTFSEDKAILLKS